MQVNQIKKFGNLTRGLMLPLLLIFGVILAGTFSSPAQAQEPSEPPFINLVQNGNFESGFYPVPELGFEPPEGGQVPLGWRWFKNSAYGKYNIYNQEGFGLACEGDDELGFLGLNSLSLHMQSTDQQDARLGVYQTVSVVPGQDYRFSMQGTIQSMQGSPEKSDRSHKVELVFDQSGGDDWTAIPNEQWTRLPWSEYLLEFKTSGPDDPDLAKIESYQTTIKAQSNKLTIFIVAWRQWADWRSVRYTIDCISLVPLNPALGTPAQSGGLFNELTAQLPEAKAAQSANSSGAQPAAATDSLAAPGSAESNPESTSSPTPAETQAIIPDSGGVLKSSSAPLLIITAISLIAGLVGAGLWNIRRKKVH